MKTTIKKSVCFSLLGFQLTLLALLGIGAGTNYYDQVAGNGSNLVFTTGYTLTGIQSANISPAQTIVYYFGADPASSVGTAIFPTNGLITIPKAGTIKRVDLKIRVNTLGSGENVTNAFCIIPANNSTTNDFTSALIPWNSTCIDTNFAGLSQTVVAGDRIAFHPQSPVTWATPPVGCRFYFTVYIE